MTCAQLRRKTRASISQLQIVYVVEQFSSLFSKDKLKHKYTKPMTFLPHACRGRTAVRFPANLVPRGRDPFVQRRGSLTSGRIRKKPSLIGR